MTDAMDRPLDSRLLLQRRLRTGSFVLGGSLVAIALLALAAGWMQPSVRRSRIRTARVVRGPIEATLSATGVIVPQFEQILASPVDTRITRILKEPGATIAKGEPIVELDVGASRLAVDTLDDQIALKANEQQRIALELESTRSSLHRQCDIKALELKSLQFTATRNRTLFEGGLTTEDAARKSDTDVDRARIELEQLQASLTTAERDHAVRREGLALEMKILRKQRAEAEHELQLAAAVSDRDGVLTWVVTSEGAAVRKGDVLARVADLGSFRVQATVSDVHAGSLRAGMPARVRIGDAIEPGEISSVHPAVDNGAITFEVALRNGRNPHLRPNLRVDVYAVVASKPGVLLLPRGSFGAPDGTTVAFVIRHDRALRTRIELGLASFEQYEVVSGLAEGDEVIVSDMSDHLHQEEVALR
jgi:HlyD family secretion protein